MIYIGILESLVIMSHNLSVYKLHRDLFKILTPRLKDWGRGWCWGWQGPAPSRGRRPPSRRARGPGHDALAELGGGCCTGSPPLGPRRLARACPEAPWLPLRLPPAGLAGRGRGGSVSSGNAVFEIKGDLILHKIATYICKRVFSRGMCAS